MIGAVRWFGAILNQNKADDSLVWESGAKDREVCAVPVIFGQTVKPIKAFPVNRTAEIGFAYLPSDVVKWYGRDVWSTVNKKTGHLRPTGYYNTESTVVIDRNYGECFIKTGAIPVALVYTNEAAKKLLLSKIKGIPVVHYKDVFGFLNGQVRQS